MRGINIAKGEGRVLLPADLVSTIPIKLKKMKKLLQK